MKHIAIIALGLLLGACGLRDLGDNLAVYTDPLTGCQYVQSYMVRGALYPRLRADGTQVCQEVAK